MRNTLKKSAGESYKEAIPKLCPWCGNTFWTTEESKVYCRRYHNKKASEFKTHQLHVAWVFLCSYFSNNQIHPDRAGECVLLNRNRCLSALSDFGYTYDPYQKQFIYQEQ